MISGLAQGSTHTPKDTVCASRSTWGSYQERGDYLSCFLHLMSGPYDAQLEWPFRAQFEVVLMNQNKDEPDWSRDINFFTCSVSPCNSRVQIQNGTCMAMGIGDPQYIKWQKLDEGYLLNDKLVFAIKCKAMPQFGVSLPVTMASPPRYPAFPFLVELNDIL